MFLSNWLVLQIVAAGVTGAVEYPSAADFFMNFDSNNRLYFTGGSKDYVSNLILYKSETEYPVYGNVSNIYISDPETYVSYIQLCNETYVTNTVDVQTVVNPEGVISDTPTNTIYGFATATVHGPSQGGFGGYIDFSGDGTRMVLGASVDFSSAQGRAYVYHLENGTWVQKADIPSPNTASQRFGDSVCMNEDGTRIAVNFYANSTIKIYDYASGAWPTSPTVSISTTTANGDMDMNKAGTVIVTGEGEGGNKAYIHTRAANGTWSETKQWSGYGGLGNGVAINGAGTRVLIGQRNASGSHPNYVGKVYEANYVGGSWGSLTEVYATAANTVNWPTRIRMDEDGTTAVIISGTNGHGRILERQSGTSWTSVMDVQGRCSFYCRGSGSISYDGTMVLTGDNYYNPGSVTSQGRAYLYEYSGGSWSLTKTYENPDASPASSDFWGYGTAITKLKDRLAIGMTGDDTAGSDYGSVHVYDLEYSYPRLTQDNYNKLTLNSLTGIQSSRLTLGSNTYDAGNASNFYVSEPGTYEVSAAGSDAYAIVKKTVAAPVVWEVFSSIPETLAFHHGTFDNAYGDGDMSTAATNGHVYSDTPLGSYSWGTLSANTTTSTETTYTWTPPGDGLISDVLMVAGGGGGGYAHGGGGGGAGGLREFYDVYITNTQQTIVVGSGGISPTSRTTKGGNGNDTTFLSYTSTGGGGGGSYGYHTPDVDILILTGNPGGSGGGGSGGWNVDGPGGSGNTPSVTPSQGNNGGTSNNNYNEGGAGGGGAGSVGLGTTSKTGAAGGGGYTSLINGNVYAGGGGGGAGDSTAGGGIGGTGGGGTGDGSAGVATAGTPHTGGGGGGGGYNSGLDRAGATGGSGIVLLSYVSYSPPKLTYDTYNKLTLSNVFTSYSSTLRYESNTYDIGTASTIIIQDPGRYEIATTDNENFLSLNSNVTGQTVTQVDVYDYTQADTTEQKITASDAASQDAFGYSVSISGDYAIVGAYGEDTGGSDAGAAYIYTRNTSTGVWGSEQKIMASNIQAQDQFGYSVSLSGDYAIVGAQYKNSHTGAAYIYTRDTVTGVWGSEQIILGETARDLFGGSVSISGDYAIVGARANTTYRGAAYIYTRNGTSWGSEQKIVASDRQTQDAFGNSVSISDDYAIVGAPYEDAGATDTVEGAAYIYTRNGTSWGSEQKIVASDRQAGDRFGYSVSLSGDYAIVGAYGEDAGATDTNEGAAYIYTRDPSTGLWGSEYKIQASDKAQDDNFGFSVSISGDYAIVGAYAEDEGGSSAGAAYVFKRDGTTWSEIKKLMASDRQAQDEFGYSVAIDGGYAISGAQKEDTGGGDAGAAYIYRAPNLASTLAYDGLNTLVLSNVSTGSYNTFLEGSNVLACATDLTTYPVPKSGTTGTFTYSARTKSSSAFAFTNDVSITDYYKTYQYPPIDGTTSGLTTSTTNATWTISGEQYSTESSVAGSPYNTFNNSITSGFDSTSSTGDITITFESSKTIRKYIVWPYDSAAPLSTPGGSTDPTLSTDGTFRPKSWTLYGTNNPSDWSTVLDTVTNQPPSIYGDVHSISSPASYQYYKLSVTANNGGSGLKIGEWQLWGDA